MTYRWSAAIAVAAFAVSTTLAAAQSWNMATPYPDGNFHTENIKMFITEVEEATDIEITLHSNASLLKMPEIKRGVQTGQAQLGEILLSAYGNEDPLFRADSIPFLAAGYVEGIRLWHLSKDAVEEKFGAKGLIPLFAVAWPGQGIYTSEAVESAEDFEGVKFRAYNAATARLAELMGAVPTTIQAAEVPQAFATGIVSAMITLAATGVDSQSWDFATHYYSVSAMNTKNLVFMNAEAFGDLDAAAQKAIMEAAERAELRGWLMSAAAESETTARLAQEGMTVSDPPAPFLEDLQEIGRTMVDEWLADAGEEGQAIVDGLDAS